MSRCLKIRPDLPPSLKNILNLRNNFIKRVRNKLLAANEKPYAASKCSPLKHYNRQLQAPGEPPAHFCLSWALRPADCQAGRKSSGTRHQPAPMEITNTVQPARLSDVHESTRQGAATTRTFEQNQAIAQLRQQPPTRQSSGTTISNATTLPPQATGGSALKKLKPLTESPAKRGRPNIKRKRNLWQKLWKHKRNKSNFMIKGCLSLPRPKHRSRRSKR